MIEDFKTTVLNIGKKAENLKRVAAFLQGREKIIVPDGISLSTGCFETLRRQTTGPWVSYRDVDIPKDLWENIWTSIKQTFGDDKLVVRSSATCEDSIFFSGAGQYESFLNISTPEEVKIAIQKIYASLFSINSYFYSKIHTIDLGKESMAVLIQRVAPVKMSGVLFSCDPITSENKIIIESTKGLGTNVVSGLGNIKRLEIDYENSSLSLSPVLERLVDVAKDIKQFFGYDVDIEWGTDADDNLYIFQVRPIIFNDTQAEIKYPDPLSDLQTYSVLSKGLTIGRIAPFSGADSNKIVCQDGHIDVNDLKKIIQSKGMVLHTDGRLSHFANIARELKKPCIVMKDFSPDPDKVYLLDGFNGFLVEMDKLTSNNKACALWSFIEQKVNNFNAGIEQFNGMITAFCEDKYEQVHFDVDGAEIERILLENNFVKNSIMQKIITFDFPDRKLIEQGRIIRIQHTNCTTRIQTKELESSLGKYRHEKNNLIEVENQTVGIKMMLELGLEETGRQERHIVQYSSEQYNTSVNIIQWPNSPCYIGVEGNTTEDIDKTVRLLGLDPKDGSALNGKQIFEKLNLKLTDCSFGG